MKRTVTANKERKSARPRQEEKKPLCIEKEGGQVTANMMNESAPCNKKEEWGVGESIQVEAWH